MSEQSTPVPSSHPRLPVEMLQADPLPPTDRLADTLLVFPNRTLRARLIAGDLQHLTFVAEDGDETAVLRVTVALPSSRSEKLAVHSGAELSVRSNGAPEFCRSLAHDYAWRLVMRLCREYDSLGRSSVEPEQTLLVDLVSRILLEEAVEALTDQAPLVFFDGGMSWAEVAYARGAQVAIGTREEGTAIEFVPHHSAGALVVDSSGNENPSADALYAFGGERLVHVGQVAPGPHGHLIDRMLANHWRQVKRVALPHPHPRGTYLSIWERLLEQLGPEHHHRQLVAKAKEVYEGDWQVTDPDRLLALLWADCCRLRRDLARKADELGYERSHFGPEGGPEDAAELALAVGCGHVPPDHEVLRKLNCDGMATKLAESAGYALYLARLLR